MAGLITYSRGWDRGTWSPTFFWREPYLKLSLSLSTIFSSCLAFLFITLHRSPPSAGLIRYGYCGPAIAASDPTYLGWLASTIVPPQRAARPLRYACFLQPRDSGVRPSLYWWIWPWHRSRLSEQLDHFGMYAHFFAASNSGIPPLSYWW